MAFDRSKNDELKRTHCVSVRLNDEELELLNRNRGRVEKGTFLRFALLTNLPPIVPKINQEAWLNLSKAHGNLATIAGAMRSGNFIEMDEIKTALAEFRQSLISPKG